MARVTLPKNSLGIEMADGTKYDNQGGYTEVADRHAPYIKKSLNGQQGFLSTTQAISIGTKKGRRCPRCHFHAQAWTTTCPRCSTPTIEEK